jgi:hypothetical protein
MTLRPFHHAEPAVEVPASLNELDRLFLVEVIQPPEERQDRNSAVREAGSLFAPFVAGERTAIRVLEGKDVCVKRGLNQQLEGDAGGKVKTHRRRSCRRRGGEGSCAWRGFGWRKGWGGCEGRDRDEVKTRLSRRNLRQCFLEGAGKGRSAPTSSFQQLMTHLIISSCGKASVRPINASAVSPQ